jgi:hypothetical protein
MTTRDDQPSARVQAVQDRIDAALREPAEEASLSRFSSYMPGDSTALQAALWTRPATGRVEDLEEILDLYGQLKTTEDPGRLRYALTVVLVHHPTVDALGLTLPSLDERSSWKTTPSRPPS